jgi:hypothetical protein
MRFVVRADEKLIFWNLKESRPMTIIPYRNGWKCFEARGVEPKTGMCQRALPTHPLLAWFALFSNF